MVSKGDEADERRERAESPTRNVVVVGLVNEQHELLLVRTSRFSSRWQPIGGGMEPGDKSPIMALMRELTEEMSIELSPDDLQFELDAAYDFGEGIVHFYTAPFRGADMPKFNSSEIVDWRWFSLQEALAAPVFPATRLFLEHLYQQKNKAALINKDPLRS